MDHQKHKSSDLVESTDDLEVFAGLSPKQTQAIKLAAESGFDLNYKQICEALEIHKTTLWRWRQEESFQRAWTKVTMSYLESEVAYIARGLIAKAKKGDANAARIVLEQLNKLRPAGSVNIDTVNIQQNILKDISEADLADLDRILNRKGDK